MPIIGGALGLFLAYRANSLLSEQNKLIVAQNDFFSQQNELVGKELELNAEVAERSKLPDWLEIANVEVTETHQEGEAEIILLVVNNSGKSCLLSSIYVISKFIGDHKLPDRVHTSQGVADKIPTFDLNTLPLYVYKEDVIRSLPKLIEIENGRTAMFKIKTTVPSLNAFRSVDGKWTLKFKAVGFNSFTSYQDIVEIPISYSDGTKEPDVNALLEMPSKAASEGDPSAEKIKEKKQ